MHMVRERWIEHKANTLGYIVAQQFTLCVWYTHPRVEHNVRNGAEADAGDS